MAGCWAPSDELGVSGAGRGLVGAGEGASRTCRLGSTASGMGVAHLGLPQGPGPGLLTGHPGPRGWSGGESGDSQLPLGPLF